MAHTTTAVAPRTFAVTTALPAFTAHLSLWRMIRSALAEARQAQAEREIANYIASTGGKFTDQSEREIERIYAGSLSRL